MHVAKFKNLADILNAALTERQQASILSKMRVEILREEQRIKDARRQQRSTPTKPAPARPRATVTRPLSEYGREHARTVLARPEPDAKQTDQHERASAFLRHGKPGKAAYWAMIGEAPECGPADTTTAMTFYRKVVAAIEHGGWSHSERSALYDLEQKWSARAYGRDPRFQIAGTRPGRLPAHDEKRIAEWKKRNSR